MGQDTMDMVPGTRVRFTSQALHDKDMRYYPPVGTVGEIKFRWQAEGRWYVKWPDGTTMGSGLWSAPAEALEVVGNG